jgi:hypothetical protein
MTVPERRSTGETYNIGGRWTTVGPQYFDTLKIPVLRGRAFELRDDATSEP